MIATNNRQSCLKRIIVVHYRIGTSYGQIIDNLGINGIPEIYGANYLGTDQVLGNNNIIVIGIVVNHCLP